MCVVALLVGNLMNKPALRARHRSASRLRDLRSSATRAGRDAIPRRESETADHTRYSILLLITHFCTTCVQAKIICNEYFGVRYLRPATTTVP